MASQANQALPEGTRLDKYRIVRTLAAGGFSIVYLAHDDNDAPVVIKEYLPASRARRTDAGHPPKIPPPDLPPYPPPFKPFLHQRPPPPHLPHPHRSPERN